MQRLSLNNCHIQGLIASWQLAAVMSLGAALMCLGCEKPREATRDASVQTPVSAGDIAEHRTTATSGLPRLIDLGAGKCIPCKKMAPILDELKEEYAGVLEVVFVDVWENPDDAKEYNIEVIPTQIFYDVTGRELFRHEGFFSKEEILGKWKELGIDLEKKSSQHP